MKNSSRKKNPFYIISILFIILIDIWLAITHYQTNSGKFDFIHFISMLCLTSMLIVFFSTVPVFIESMMKFKEPDQNDFKLMTDRMSIKYFYYIGLLFIPISLFFA